eukprot:jgi/Mesvir1/1646/Mv02884-RA.1
MPPNRSRRTSTRSTSARARPRKAARKTIARKNIVARTRTSVRRGVARRRTHTTRAYEYQNELGYALKRFNKAFPDTPAIHDGKRTQLGLYGPNKNFDGEELDHIVNVLRTVQDDQERLRELNASIDEYVSARRFFQTDGKQGRLPNSFNQREAMFHQRAIETYKTATGKEPSKRDLENFLSMAGGASSEYKHDTTVEKEREILRKFDRRIGDYDDARVQRLLNEGLIKEKLSEPARNPMANPHAAATELAALRQSQDARREAREREKAAEKRERYERYLAETAKMYNRSFPDLVQMDPVSFVRNPTKNSRRTELADLAKRAAEMDSENEALRYLSDAVLEMGKAAQSRKAYRAEKRALNEERRARRAEKEAQKKASRVHESVAREEPRRAEGVAQPRQPVSVDRAPVAREEPRRTEITQSRQVVSVAPGPAARVVDEPGDAARGAGAKSGDRANAGARKAGRTGRGTLEHEYDTWVAGRRLYATRRTTGQGRPRAGQEGRTEVDRGPDQTGRTCVRQARVGQRDVPRVAEHRALPEGQGAFVHERRRLRPPPRRAQVRRGTARPVPQGQLLAGRRAPQQVCLLHRETPASREYAKGKATAEERARKANERADERMTRIREAMAAAREAIEDARDPTEDPVTTSAASEGYDDPDDPDDPDEPYADERIEIANPAADPARHNADASYYRRASSRRRRSRGRRGTTRQVQGERADAGRSIRGRRRRLADARRAPGRAPEAVTAPKSRGSSSPKSTHWVNACHPISGMRSFRERRSESFGSHSSHLRAAAGRSPQFAHGHEGTGTVGSFTRKASLTNSSVQSSESAADPSPSSSPSPLRSSSSPSSLAASSPSSPAMIRRVAATSASRSGRSM